MKNRKILDSEGCKSEENHGEMRPTTRSWKKPCQVRPCQEERVEKLLQSPPLDMERSLQSPPSMWRNLKQVRLDLEWKWKSLFKVRPLARRILKREEES